MSPRLQYLVSKTVPFAGVPITLGLAQLLPNVANFALGMTFGGVIAGNIYAELLVRCPKCNWRVGSYGKPFAKSMPRVSVRSAVRSWIETPTSVGGRSLPLAFRQTLDAHRCRYDAAGGTP
jgi:hypothetical protein